MAAAGPRGQELVRSPLGTSGRFGGGVAAILLLEDDADLRAMLVEFLVDEGYAVTPAATATEGQAAAAAMPFDLVITDAVWGRDPAAIAAGAHALRGAGVAPVVLCTADGNLAALDPAALGVSAIVAKPFELEAFLAVVASLVGSARP
jgi:DNA-binding response OmpR family regulator